MNPTNPIARIRTITAAFVGALLLGGVLTPPISAQGAEASGPLVLSSGNVAVTPLIGEVDGTNFASFELGLLDKTVGTEPQWYSPEDAVLHFSATEFDAASGLWATPPGTADIAGYTTGADARLLLGIDVASASANSGKTGAVRSSPQAPTTLVAMTGPEEGRFRAFASSVDSPAWDSSWLGTATTQSSLTAPKANPNRYFGWAFDAPGKYCVTLEQTLRTQGTQTDIAAQATYTVYVGDLPGHPTTCADDVASDGPVVLSSGNVAVTPLIGEVDGTNFASFEMGLLDKTVGAEPQWYSPEDAVLHLGSAELEAGMGLWATPPGVADIAAYTTGADARLLLGIDVAATSVNNGKTGAIRSSPQAPTTLVAMTGPDGGRFRAFASSVDSPAWDSSWLGTATVQGNLTAPKANPNRYFGWAFDAPGKYCVTLSQTLRTQGTQTDITVQATYTVYVGDLPAHPTTCTDEGAGAEDPEEPIDPGTPVTVLDNGHLDVRTVLSAEAETLRVGVYKSKFYDAADVVLAGTYSGVIPPPSDDLDLTFVGEPGSPYWYFAEGGGDSTHLWPGFSTENFSGSELALGAMITFTLEGMNGPDGGDVVLYTSGATNLRRSATYVKFDSTLQQPQSWTVGTGTHAHMYWAFTAPGRYCLNMSTSTQAASGAWVRGQSQLTVWAGDPTAASTVIPCDRDTAPSTFSPAPMTLGTDPYVSRSDQLALLPHLSESGSLGVAVSTQVRATDPVGYRDPSNVLISIAYKQGGTYSSSNATAPDLLSRSPQISIDTDLVPWASIDGLVNVSLGDVRGPGTVHVSSIETRRRLLLASDGVRELAVSPTSQPGTRWEFTAPGVYCVPLELSLTPAAAGSPVSRSITLTFAVGSEDPASADYFDRAGLTTCDRGQRPTAPEGDPGTDPDDQDPDVWDVPNGTSTLSGATILNNGHIDIASLLNGGHLVTRIKDTTESSEPTWRDPAETVLQLLPGGRTQVPDDTHYAFLGAAGADLWQVTQTQQDGLLWPGWSTESIPVEATLDGVRWTLTDASGPGEFAIYEAGFELGTVVPIFNTRDGITSADSYLIPKDTHAHGTWAFGAEGVYCLAFTRSTTPTGGTKVSDDFTLAVAVGEVDVRKVDPSKCFTTPAGAPAEQDRHPIADDELTDATAGGVQVLDGARGFTPGQLVTVQVGTAYAGEWVSVWLHSDPTWLGWAQVSTSGALQVRLPADAALGGHKIVVKDRDGALIGWDALSVVAPPDTTPPPPTPPAQDPTYPNAQCVAGSTILSSGHIDYSTRIVGGKIESLVGDDTGASKVYREPSGTILWLKPSSAVQLPAGYGSVGPVGSTVWQVPQTQNANLIWLGWSTEALNAGNTSGPVTWTLNSVSGPGSVKVYTLSSFGGVSMVLNGSGSSTSIPLGTHAHGNWAFSAEGVYRLSFTQTATLANGQTSSDTETVTIVVGNVDPASAAGGSGCGAISNAILGSDDADAAKLAAEQASAAAALAARDLLPGEAGTGGFVDPITALNQGNPVPLLLGVLGGLLLVGAAGTGVLWWRRRVLA